MHFASWEMTPLVDSVERISKAADNWQPLKAAKRNVTHLFGGIKIDLIHGELKKLLVNKLFYFRLTIESEKNFSTLLQDSLILTFGIFKVPRPL